MTDYQTSENGLCPTCGSGEVVYVLNDKKLSPVHRFLLRNGRAIFAGDVMDASALQVG
jgi:hypothetical protein